MSTSVTERLPLAQAERLAWEILDLLTPSCSRIAVAGSIRRRKEAVGDIEIVAVPKFIEKPAADLFGVKSEMINALDQKCAVLLDGGFFDKRGDKNGRLAYGERYKRLSYQGFPLDLFSVLPPANWGVVFLIRTGPAEFSHRFVTSRRQGGMLPDWARVQDGAIRHKDGSIIPALEERDVFTIIGQPWIEPEARS